MTTMKTRMTALLMLLYVSAQGQDFAAIDAQARKVPFPKGQNIGNLTAALSKGCTTEKEQVRAFFVWVCENIRYDIKTFEDKKDVTPEEHKELNEPESVLKNHKGVCEGYSNLFVAMCKEVDIVALKVVGISKNSGGRVSRGGHAWCMVRTDGQWGLLDATWGAGNVDLDASKFTKRFDEKHFLTPPELMILDHYPMDPLFQLLQNPLTLEDFRQASMKPSPKQLNVEPLPGFGNITDSLEVFIQLDSTAMLYSAGTRMLNFEPNSNAARLNLGLYHFQSANTQFNTTKAARFEWQNARKPFTVAWCDEQIAQCESAKSKFKVCMDLADTSNTNDDYSSGLRTLRRNAEKMRVFTEKDIENLKKIRSRAD